MRDRRQRGTVFSCRRNWLRGNVLCCSACSVTRSLLEFSLSPVGFVALFLGRPERTLAGDFPSIYRGFLPRFTSENEGKRVILKSIPPERGDSAAAGKSRLIFSGNSRPRVGKKIWRRTGGGGMIEGISEIISSENYNFSIKGKNPPEFFPVKRNSF